MTVLGVDWGHREWVAVVIDDGGFVAGFTAPTIADTEARAIEEFGVGLIVVDIPIGLPDHGPRAADTLARARVCARASSVFPTPVRATLFADDHAAATAASVRATGKGLSTQGHGLRHRILEVDAFLPRARVRVLEGHPEVSFAEINGGPLPYGKHSAAGVVERRRLLRAADTVGIGIVIPDDAMAGFGASGLDDVHDAAAMAWTARRAARGEAFSLPDPPEVFSDGVPSAIWV